MSLLRRVTLFSTGAFAAGGTVLLLARSVPAAPTGQADRPADQQPAFAPAVKPKALTPVVTTGLDFLTKTQLDSGGWGQGDESAEMGGGRELKSVANVADSAMAILALLRAGSTPSEGRHARPISRGVDFVVTKIEASDADSLSVTDVQGTRTQMKLGPFVDTFAANLMLSEVKGKMPTDALNARVDRALTKVLHKIEKNQKQDGTWDKNGWAPALSQALAAKGINRSAQAGAKVDDSVRERAEDYAGKQFDGKSGGFGGEGSAGVQLYSGAASVGSQSDSVNTNNQRETELKAMLADPALPKAQKEAAQKRLDHYAVVKKSEQAAQGALVKRLEDPSFINGFGSNGGEEFLSYMLVSESLVVKGGAEWEQWDRSMIANLSRVQNADGSWTGHHCITGRTFVTSAALLVLTADRAPVPVASRMRKG